MRSFPFDSLDITYDENKLPIFDRDYTAEDLREDRKAFFSDGVFMDSDQALQVTAGDGMSVLVSPGKCEINGTTGYEKNERKLVLQAASSQDRIDTVVARWNNNNDTRSIDLYVRTGVAQDVPVRPTLVRNESVFELGLGDVYIAADTTTVVPQRITDTRLETERCGIVTPFAQIDTTTFYTQIQAAIDAKIAEIDALADFTYLQGGFYAVHVDDEDGHLYAYYDSEDNPPPLSLEGGRMYYTIGENKLDLGSASAQPAGIVNAFAGIEAPTGWLICDGAEVSREDYAELFAAIGETYGAGDGDSTFNLPNLTGRFLLGESESHELAEEGGEETVTLSVEQMPSHNHSTLTYYGGVGNGGATQRGWSGDTAARDLYSAHTGGGQAHNNMPPYLAMKYIISIGR